MVAAVILLIGYVLTTVAYKLIMFVFTKLSNIIRIKYTVKISYKMRKQGRHSDKGSTHVMLYFSMLFS